jgi:hypothetical protein
MMAKMEGNQSNQFYGALLSQVQCNGADVAWLVGRALRRIAAAVDAATCDGAIADTVRDVATWIEAVNDDALATIDSAVVEMAIEQVLLDGFAGRPSWLEHPVHASQDDVSPPTA